MKKIRFAVVGAGHIGKRHAQMIQENPNTELLAIIDTDTSLKNAVSTQFSVPFYASLDEFIATTTAVDIITICTPNHLHCEQALIGLNYAHVVIEKPMGLTVSECEKVISKAQSVNKQVFCVMQNRYSPPSQLLKSIVSEDKLGSIYNVQVNCFWNRDERYYAPNGKKHAWKGIVEKDGGVLFTQFSHFIDTLHWLFGDLKVSHKAGANFTHQHLSLPEDTGYFSFALPNGGIGTFNYSTSVWDTNLESSMTIIGEKGSIKIAGQYMNEVVHCHIQDYTLPELAPTNPPNDYGTYKGSAANHHYVIENIVEVLANDGKMTTSAIDGLEVVKIITAVYS